MDGMADSLIPSIDIERKVPVTGKTLLFPLIGHPVDQVRAPSVFNSLFERAGVDALCLGLDLAPESVVATARSLLAAANVGGLLVTVPYKKTLAEVADRLGAAATQVGALNALRRAADGKVEGELFDGHGFVRGLQAAGHDLTAKRVLLLGAGGAGSAIAAALAHAGVGELAIYDPSATSVEALIAGLRPQFLRTTFRRHAQPLAADCDMVVNASPLGLKPEDPLPMDPAGVRPGTLVCDIIMKPPTTRFLHAALSRGLPVHRGQHMLDEQVPAYLSFFGLDQLASRIRITPEAVLLSD